MHPGTEPLFSARTRTRLTLSRLGACPTYLPPLSLLRSLAEMKPHRLCHHSPVEMRSPYMSLRSLDSRSPPDQSKEPIHTRINTTCPELLIAAHRQLDRLATSASWPLYVDDMYLDEALGVDGGSVSPQRVGSCPFSLSVYSPPLRRKSAGSWCGKHGGYLGYRYVCGSLAPSACML